MYQTERNFNFYWFHREYFISHLDTLLVNMSKNFQLYFWQWNCEVVLKLTLNFLSDDRLTLKQQTTVLLNHVTRIYRVCTYYWFTRPNCKEYGRRIPNRRIPIQECLVRFPRNCLMLEHCLMAWPIYLSFRLDSTPSRRRWK